MYLSFSRLIDLSHTLIPGGESRTLEADLVHAEEVEQSVTRLPHQWYIMHNVRMVDHIGTHIEVPYHCLKNGDDLARVPLYRLFGEGIVLDLRNKGKEPFAMVTAEDVSEAAARAGGMKQGDIVLAYTGYSDFFGTPKYREAPIFSKEALQWLIDQGMVLFAIDSSGPGTPPNAPPGQHHATHLQLFERGIPIIENLTNLQALTKGRVGISALPVAIKGLDGFPVRVVAFE